MSAAVHLGSIGLAVPGTVVTQADAERIAQRNRGAREAAAISRVFRGTRIATRHVVLDGLDDAVLTTNPTTAERMKRYAEHAPALAHEACRKSLDGLGIEGHAITHLVTASCTGFVAPGVDHLLIRSLGLSPGVERTHIGYMGCHGAINAIAVAAAIAQSQPGSRVLVCCVELCSLHHHAHPTGEQLVANALFADGAAACIIGAGVPGWRIGPRASRVLEGTGDLMGWSIGDHGFEMSLGREVPAILRQQIGPWAGDLLRRAERAAGDIGGFAIHPGGPGIVQAVGDSMGLPEAALAPSLAVLERYGNMSSPTVLFVLDEIARRHGLVDSALLAFGPGLSAEGLVLLA